MDKSLLDYKIELLDKKLNKEDLQIKVAVLNKEYWGKKDIAIMKECGQNKASDYRALVIDYIRTVMKKDVPVKLPSKICIKVLDIDSNKIREKYKQALEVEKDGMYKGAKPSNFRPSEAV